MWWFYNGNVYLYQLMCAIYYNLPGNIYSGGSANCIVNLPGKYYYISLLNTRANKYCVQCMVGNCIGKWWL